MSKCSKQALRSYEVLPICVATYSTGVHVIHVDCFMGKDVI